MIVEQLLTVASHKVNKGDNTLFSGRDAELISKTFILFPDIVQVGMFGGIARDGVGYSINLALVVSDEGLFRKYVDLVREYQKRTDYARDERQVRLAAFDVVWGRHNPAWHNSHPERKLNLRESLDLVVLPFDWQNRVNELEPVLGQASPAPLSEISAVVTFIETQV